MYIKKLHMILIHLNKILDVNKLDKERSVYFYVFKNKQQKWVIVENQTA